MNDVESLSGKYTDTVLKEREKEKTPRAAFGEDSPRMSNL